MTPIPTVAVIGAGISGLTTLKMLDDYGIEAGARARTGRCTSTPPSTS